MPIRNPVQIVDEDLHTLRALRKIAQSPAAFHLMCSSKKGISALQLQRELWGENEETKKIKGSYRTAWFMCHRIRWTMTQSPMPSDSAATVAWLLTR